MGLIARFECTIIFLALTKGKMRSQYHFLMTRHSFNFNSYIYKINNDDRAE